VTDTDDLADALFRLETSTLTTSVVTAGITRAVIEWAAARGWVKSIQVPGRLAR